MTNLTTTGHQALPKPLRVFLAIQIIMAALCAGAELVCRFLLHLPLPYNWPLTPVKERTVDLNEYADRFKYLHSSYFFFFRPKSPFAYPAPMAWLYRIAYMLPKHRTPVFLLIVVLCLATGVYLVARAAARGGFAFPAVLRFCAASAALSYPFLFEAKQGNLELVIWVLVASGVWLLLRGKGYSAAACFSIAGSMKIFPLVYLGLHLSERRWKEFLFGLGLIIPVTVGSLWLLTPDIPFAWHHLQANMAYAQDQIVLRIVHREIGFDHSLFSVVKRLWLIAGRAAPLSSVLRVYLLCSGLTGFVLYFGRIRQLPFANQVLSLAVCSILLPPVSYDYTLIHLYVPLAIIFLLITQKGIQRLPRGTTVLLALLSFAVAPLSEVIAHGVRFGGQVRAFVLLALLIAALLFPLRVAEAAGAALEPEEMEAAGSGLIGRQVSPGRM